MISILMPVKNAGNWLEDCVSSIRAQSLSDWELLAVNDHSDDHSSSILKRLTKQDGRVKPLSNNGHGIIDALRTAYDASSGEFIHRMDADDLMPEDKLETLHLGISRNPDAVITGKVRYFSKEKISAGYRVYEKWLNSRVDKNDHWSQIYRECVIASPNWLISRERFDQATSLGHLTYPEDYHMVFKWYEAGLEIYGIDRVTHLWREHAKRTSRNSYHYTQRAFFELKIARFVQLDRDPGKPLLLIGTGRKARLTAQILYEKAQEHYRVVKTEEEASQGLNFISKEEIVNKFPAQLLCAVAPNTSNGRRIAEFLNELNLVQGRDYWFL